MSLFDDIGVGESPTPVRGGGLFGDIKPDDSSDIWRGGKEAFQQLPQLGYGLLAGAGAAAENVVGEGGIATGIKKAGVKGYQEWSDKIQAGSKESDSWDYSWDKAKEGDFGALKSWVAHGIGYTGGQGLQMLVGAGLGAAVGKLTLGTAAETIASGMVRKQAGEIATAEAAKLLGEGAAKEALAAKAAELAVTPAIQKAAVSAAASRMGQLAAVGGSAFGQEGGEIFGDLTQNAENDGGRTPTGAELGKAFISSLAAGGLEFIGDKIGLDIILGKSRFLKPAKHLGAGGGLLSNIGGRVARGGIAAVTSTPIEAGTEYFQTGLEEYGKGNEASPLPFQQSEEGRRQARESAMLGGLGGLVMGGGGGMIHAAQPRAPVITKGVADIAAAPTVDEAIKAADAAVSTTPAAPTAPTLADRVATVKAELSDRSVMQAVRDKYGDDGASQFLNSLNQAGNKNATDLVREKHLQAVEDALFQLNATRIQPPAGLLSLAGPDAAPALGYDALPQIGMGSTPTGTMRVGPDGVAAPETVADVTAGRQDRMARDGLTAQAPQGSEPGVGVLVGEGTLTPGFANRDVPQTAMAQALLPLRDRLDSLRRENGPNAIAPEQTANQQPAEVAAPAGQARGTELAGSSAVLPGVEADAAGRVPGSAAAPVAGGREAVSVGASAAEPDASLSNDLPTLRNQWREAVKANDGKLAAQINARIVEVKAGAAPAAPTSESAALPNNVVDLRGAKQIRETAKAIAKAERDEVLFNLQEIRIYRQTGALSDAEAQKAIDALRGVVEGGDFDDAMEIVDPILMAAGKKHVDRLDSPANEAKAAPSSVPQDGAAPQTTKTRIADATQVGRQAFSDGKQRMAPSAFTSLEKKGWLQGWDAANEAGPVDVAPSIANGTRPPPSELEKIKVTVDAYSADENKFIPHETDADTALKALDQDIAALKAFMRCLEG